MNEVIRVTQTTPSPRYFNRELSWVAFNQRVLEEAQDESNPLLERLRFLTIFHTNLDEFFMIRVSGLKQQVAAGIEMLTADGMTPRGNLNAVSETLHPIIEDAQACLHNSILPALAREGFQIVHYDDVSDAERKVWDAWYDDYVHPILTPLAVGPTRPFPFISNLSLNLVTFVESPKGERRLARVKVPGVLPRLVPHPSGESDRYVLLEELVAHNLRKLFPGMTVETPWQFRVTRDADVEIRDDEANDLMKTVQEGLRRRRFGEAVRLEVQRGCPDEILEALMAGLRIDEPDVYSVDGILAVPRLNPILELDRPDLKFQPFSPKVPRAMSGDIFADIRAGDVLLHHPYDSFAPIVEFVRAAAHDPKVLAIKQTLYRTSGDSPVIKALEEAVENGKQVAAIVELKARFDEENNITWARRLEEAGVHVVYGVTGLKTHSKVALVVREEGGKLRRYAHIGTGNYNPATARVYTDFGLLTSHRQITRDIADIFNRMTGFARPPRYRSLLVAPHHMRKHLLKRIKRETKHAKKGEPASMLFKCNALTDPEIIDTLYEASRAGVQIDLLVRGVCCLVPGVPDQSQTIRVRSVVGRFLEHSRAYWFENGGKHELYIGSADLMQRNLDRRVEVLTPVVDPDIARTIRTRILDLYLEDCERSRVLQSDGEYVRLRGDEPGLDVQESLLEAKRR